MANTDWILGMDFSKLPQELQEKTVAARKAFLRVRKAETQLELWRKEIELAGQEYKATQASQAEALNRWNPDTNELTPLEELSAKAQ